MNYYDDCAKWLASFLPNHIVLRSSTIERLQAKQVNLLSLSEMGKLLCFSYESHNYPMPRAFDLTPIRGEDLGQQLSMLMDSWKRLGMRFWTAETQAVVCEISGAGSLPINACSREMLWAYHGMKVCLETHPYLEGASLADIITAQQRLNGFLSEKNAAIDQAIATLSGYTNR